MLSRGRKVVKSRGREIGQITGERLHNILQLFEVKKKYWSIPHRGFNSLRRLLSLCSKNPYVSLALEHGYKSFFYTHLGGTIVGMRRVWFVSVAERCYIISCGSCSFVNGYIGCGSYYTWTELIRYFVVDKMCEFLNI